MPEKYFTPSILESLHDTSESKVTFSGAPHFGGKLTFHAPVISSGPGTVVISARRVLPPDVFNS